VGVISLEMRGQNTGFNKKSFTLFEENVLVVASK